MGLFNLFKKKKKSSSNNLDNYHNSPKRILKGYIYNRNEFDSFEVLKSLTTGDKNQWSRCVHLLLLIELSQQQWKRFIDLMHLSLDLGKKIFEIEINPSGKEVNPALNYVMYGFDGSGGSDLWNVYWEIQKKEKFNIHKDISFAILINESYEMPTKLLHFNYDNNAMLKLLKEDASIIFGERVNNEKSKFIDLIPKEKYKRPTKKNPEDSLSDLIQTLLIYIFHSRRGINIWEYWGDKYESYPYSNNSLIEERLHRLFELLNIDFSKYDFFFADLIKLYKSPYFVINEYRNMDSEKFVKYFLELAEGLEDSAREKNGYPKKGSKWISETHLFNLIKNYFTKHKVIQHSSPDWLVPQHLDIHFTDLNIAIEYQGDQHFRPVEFFGGEEAFKKQQKRDKTKKLKCEQNECELIYVLPDYDFEKLIKQLEKTVKKKSKIIKQN